MNLYTIIEYLVSVIHLSYLLKILKFLNFLGEGYLLSFWLFFKIPEIILAG